MTTTPAQAPQPWLSAGVDPTIVAEWAGHSVAVLLRVYAKTVTGRDDVARARVEQALGPTTAPASEPAPARGAAPVHE